MSSTPARDVIDTLILEIVICECLDIPIELDSRNDVHTCGSKRGTSSRSAMSVQNSQDTARLLIGLAAAIAIVSIVALLHARVRPC